MQHSKNHIAPLLGLMVVGFGSLALPAVAQSGTEDISSVFQRIITEERDRSEVMANLEYLSDSIGPRLTGSDRLKRANDWTAEKMKQYGLENVHLESYTIPRGWERGTISARLAEPSGLPVSLQQAAWTPGTDGKLTGPVVIMTADTEEDLAAYKGKLNGAFVMVTSKMFGSNGDGALPLPDQKDPRPIPALSPAGQKPKPKQSMFGMPKNFDYKKYMAFRARLNEMMAAEGTLGTLRDAGKPYDLLGKLGLLTDRPSLFPGKMNGTGHASFDDAGVPAFAYNQEDANYELNHHSQADTYDKARPDDLKQGACAMAIMAYDAAQKAERFPRKPEKRAAAQKTVGKS